MEDSTCVVWLEIAPESVAVALTGELDMADADQVGEMLVTAVDSGTRVVRVLLDDLKFADSSAIKAILIGAQAAQERGVGFELVNPRGVVQRLLEVTGLDAALTVVHESQADA